MEYRFTRQELYDRVWSKPMSHLVAEMGTTTGILTTLLRRADIPTPSSGHWMRKQFGKPVERPPLPSAPSGCVEPLVLDTRKQSIKSKPTSAKANAASISVVVRPVSEPAAESLAEAAPKPRPTWPTTMTREELYGAVWTTPMSRLAEGYGISGNGLAKICDRENIPYPPRGYWAKHAVGKAPNQTPLPKSGSARSVTIRPTPLPLPPIELPPEVQHQVEKARASESALVVPERLLRPHAVIASWLAEHEEKKRQARNERDPWTRNLYRPREFNETDRRNHRILDALFKAIERQGGKVKQGERGVLFAEVLGEKVEFQVCEKQRQERRPLTDDEKRWRSPGDKGWRQELVPTGWLVFEIKTWQWPAGLPRQWLESEKQPMEGMLPDILATFIAVGPLLVQQRKDREAAERERQLAEKRRYEDQQRRKRAANRWRRFRELAQDWHELAAVRDFLAALRSMDTTSTVEIDGRTVEEWITWAEESLNGPIRQPMVSMAYSLRSPVSQIGRTEIDGVNAGACQSASELSIAADDAERLAIIRTPRDHASALCPVRILRGTAAIGELRAVQHRTLFSRVWQIDIRRSGSCKPHFFQKEGLRGLWSRHSCLLHPVRRAIISII